MFKTNGRATWWRSAFATSFLLSMTVIGVGARECLAQPITLQAIADASVRTDLDVRRNDNYGCEAFLLVGTSRGGGGLPFGGADAMRALIQFDLSAIPSSSVTNAILELTIFDPPYDNGQSTSVYTVNVHRVLAPWMEGNGNEVSPPSGCTGTDPADGMAWAGAGDNADPDAANNQTQPPFDPTVIATAVVNQDTNVAGDVIHFDVTSLAQAWVNGTVPNHGILLRDLTSDGSFRGVRFGAREESEEDNPRLVVTTIPVYSCTGFEPPFDVPIALKKKVRRAIPLKIELFSNGTPITDANIAGTPPVVSITYTAGGAPAVDVTGELEPLGMSNEGNMFRFAPADGHWIFNLGTAPFMASGTYTVTVAAGDTTYGVDPTCTGQFIRND